MFLQYIDNALSIYTIGSALIKVGQCQQKLGQIERDFISTSANCYIQPLRKFLEGEMKTISKEMAILATKRYAILIHEHLHKIWINSPDFDSIEDWIWMHVKIESEKPGVWSVNRV